VLSRSPERSPKNGGSTASVDGLSTPDGLRRPSFIVPMHDAPQQLVLAPVRKPGPELGPEDTSLLSGSYNVVSAPVTFDEDSRAETFDPDAPPPLVLMTPPTRGGDGGAAAAAPFGDTMDESTTPSASSSKDIILPAGVTPVGAGYAAAAAARQLSSGSFMGTTPPRSPSALGTHGFPRLASSVIVHIPVDTAHGKINVPIDVKPSDVTIRMVDRRPSMVLTMSEGVKAQLMGAMERLETSARSGSPSGRPDAAPASGSSGGLKTLEAVTPVSVVSVHSTPTFGGTTPHESPRATLVALPPAAATPRDEASEAKKE